jgi:hypothetical protein
MLLLFLGWIILVFAVAENARGLVRKMLRGLGFLTQEIQAARSAETSLDST